MTIVGRGGARPTRRGAFSGCAPFKGLGELSGVARAFFTAAGCLGLALNSAAAGVFVGAVGLFGFGAVGLFSFGAFGFAGRGAQVSCAGGLAAGGAQGRGTGCQGADTEEERKGVKGFFHGENLEKEKERQETVVLVSHRACEAVSLSFTHE